ncbi:radical SAM protein [Patescibacteria group bacterium]|nr:radical SAM protein [Patescibacteria group bacterium]MBU1921723.1 radical SAM protein [Patescibacteria group bacterium]
MARIKKQLDRLRYKYIFYPAYLLKRHLINQILTGRWFKPMHLMSVFIKSKLLCRPYLAIIETANFCNLNCPTCTTPHNKITREKKSMTLDDFKKIMDKVSPYCHVALLYNSNEPLLHPNLSEMISYADKKNLYTMISSNATLLNEEMTGKILKSGLDEILLCLDGMSKQSYEPFRRGADFETVKDNIINFCGEKKKRGLVKPYVELQFILTSLNQNEVPLIKEFAKEIGVDRLHIKSFALSEYAYSKEEIKKLSEEFFPLESKYSKKIIYDKKDDGTLDLKRGKDWLCSLAEAQLVVLVDGSLSMCCYDINGKYIYGSLMDKDFLSIWNDPKVQKIRAMAKKGELSLCKICGAY